MGFSLSKSKYCNAVQCPKMLWLKDNKPEEFDDSVMNQAVLDTGSEVGDLAMSLFGAFIEVPNGTRSEMVKATKAIMKDNASVIAEASFEYKGLFCSVDLLKRTGENRFELYEVKSSTELHEIYLHDVAYQVYVLTSLGYEIDKVCVVHINSNYVRRGDLDLSKLFKIEDVTKDAKARHDEVERNITALKAYMRKKKEPEKHVSMDCFNPYQCGFFKYCTKEFPSPNVFDLAGVTTAKKVEYCEDGLISFGDLFEAGVLKAKPKMQVQFELQPCEDHIELKPIREFLDPSAQLMGQSI